MQLFYWFCIINQILDKLGSVISISWKKFHLIALNERFGDINMGAGGTHVSEFMQIHET